MGAPAVLIAPLFGGGALEIRSESRISHPRDRVWIAYRDRLPDVARHIPDIERITVVSREEVPGGVRLHNEWVAQREIPAVAQRFLRPEHLRWDDHATWQDEGYVCDWVIRPRAFTDAVTCHGRNVFVDDGDDTLVRMQGVLEIRLHDIPGVPSFVGRRIAPQIERFIVSLITPNFQATSRAIQTWLDAESA